MASVTLYIELTYEVEVGDVADISILAQKAKALADKTPAQIIGRPLAGAVDWGVQVKWITPDTETKIL